MGVNFCLEEFAPFVKSFIAQRIKPDVTIVVSSLRVMEKQEGVTICLNLYIFYGIL